VFGTSCQSGEKKGKAAQPLASGGEQAGLVEGKQHLTERERK